MASKASKKAAKSNIDTSLFKRLAPRMMRDLIRDFSPLADFQAAGAVGQWRWRKRRLHPNPGAAPDEPGSKGGLGFFQWTGMGANGRRRVLEKLLKEMNRNPDSYDANYEMLRRELKGTERATIPKLRKAKDIDEATKIFMVSFERPGIPHYEGRVTWSKMALQAYQAEEKKIAKDPVGITSQT